MAAFPRCRPTVCCFCALFFYMFHTCWGRIIWTPTTPQTTTTTRRLDSEIIEAAFNLDYAPYTQMDYAFQWHNAQNYYPLPYALEHGDDYCMEDYLRCIYSFVYPIKICAYTGGYRAAYNKHFYSPCEVWLFNCRIRIRMWFSTGARAESSGHAFQAACRYADTW